MGFDIECIVDIHTYPGEYFCPVCRTLVYPNEAFQTQCTHLYCKPCLVHVANGSRACPYDGYLVTEADSKRLIDSDKALVENIGKVKVHCLFFRSGCTWEGTLADCMSHCSGCSFGNSPVICNRCGIQIVHSQVHDHAQTCPGTYDGQQAAGGISSVTRSNTVSSAATTVVAQAAGPPSQPQNTPVVTPAAPVPAQNPNPQVVNGHSQAAVIAPVAAPTPEQWYQQQYYQQYVGYDPYQQLGGQQYYSFQHQPFQQYQQHPVPQVQGQPQSHVYPQQQTQPPPQQHAVVPQAHGQAQPQMQLPPQAPPQGQAQASVPNYQAPQQQTRPQAQVPVQTLPAPPHSQPPFAQAMGVRPPAQHTQVPQYQQPHVQMHHPQNPQPQLQTQPQPQPQPQPQHYHTLPQPHILPSQANYSTAPAALPPAPPGPPASGHHSYQQPQLPQKMHSGASLQNPVHPHPAGGSSYPVPVPHQPGQMRPPLSHGSLSQQPQHQVPGIPSSQHQQQIPPHPQQPTHSIQHRAVFHPVQQAASQHYAQQQQFPAPFPNQQGQLPHQQPMQSQMRPSAPVQPPPSQNYVGRALMPNQGIHSQNHSFSTGAFGSLSHPGPAQPASAQTPVNQNYMQTSVPEQNKTVQETISPSKGLVDKGFDGERLKDVVGMGKSGTVLNDVDSNAKDGLKSVTKQGEDVKGPLVQDEIGKEAGHSLAGSDSLRQGDRENQVTQLSKTVGAGPSSGNIDMQSHTAASASTVEGHVLPPQSHDSYQQRPQAQVQGQPPSTVWTEGRGPGYSVPPQNSFESQSGSQGITTRAPPRHFEGQYGPQHVGRPSEAAVSKDRMSGSVDGGPPVKNHSDEPNFFRMNGGSAPDSMFGSRDEKLKALPREHLNPFPGEPTHTFNQVSRSLDKAPGGPIFDAGSKLDQHSRMLPHHPSGGHSNADVFGAGHEFGQHHMKHFTRRSPDREYSSPRGFGGPSNFSRNTSAFDDKAHRFGEEPRSSNLSADSIGNPFRDGRFPPSGHLPRGDNGGPRFGEHDVFGPDGGPGHSMRGNFSGPGYLPGHFHMDETAGSGAFSGHGSYPHQPLPESARGDRSSFPHFGGPAMRNNYSLPGFPNSGNFAPGMDAFDHSRKRSTGWCRICGVDCETVEGLDMHSQTREHQQMAMDMVRNIKMQNRKKQRTTARMPHEGGSRTRKAGNGGRGRKP